MTGFEPWIYDVASNRSTHCATPSPLGSKFVLYQTNLHLDCGGGQVVSMFAFYSDDPSSNPAKA